MNPVQNAAFDSEIAAAKRLIAGGALDQGFVHLERAHVLGQSFVVPHARSHWLMLQVEIRRQRFAAALGQMVRIVLGVIGSAVGVVPIGNTGGSDISMFKRMPIAPELQHLIEGDMPVIEPCDVPEDSLLSRYQSEAGFADCYVTEVPGAISQAAYIEAFYTSPLFKVERTILKFLVAKPATDADARQLAAGAARSFSAWNVEGQSSSELLLADFSGRTRSWLMTSSADEPGRMPGTRLYFGSAVVPRASSGSRKPDMGRPFHALLGFHRLYSRLLLRAARSRVRPG